jgi:hypothetical protein
MVSDKNSGAVVIGYKSENEHFRDFRLLKNGDLEVVCTRRNRLTEDLMVICHNTTKSDIEHMIYALRQIQTFVE